MSEGTPNNDLRFCLFTPRPPPLLNRENVSVTFLRKCPSVCLSQKMITFSLCVRAWFERCSELLVVCVSVKNYHFLKRVRWGPHWTRKMSTYSRSRNKTQNTQFELSARAQSETLRMPQIVPAWTLSWPHNPAFLVSPTKIMNLTLPICCLPNFVSPKCKSGLQRGTEGSNKPSANCAKCEMAALPIFEQLAHN